jgi:hypothetical protein
VIGEVLVKGLDAFKRGFLFGQGTVHGERLTPTIKRAYRAVHRGWSERTPILVFSREIPVAGEGPVVAMTTEIEERLKQDFRSKPVHIVWPMKDPAFLPSYLDTLWLDTFPDATVTRLAPGRGHPRSPFHAEGVVRTRVRRTLASRPLKSNKPAWTADLCFARGAGWC